MENVKKVKITLGAKNMPLMPHTAVPLPAASSALPICRTPSIPTRPCELNYREKQRIICSKRPLRQPYQGLRNVGLAKGHGSEIDEGLQQRRRGCRRLVQIFRQSEGRVEALEVDALLDTDGNSV